MKLTIERLGHQGEGIARGPDGPVYVPMALPGEEVEAEVDGDRARDVKILVPSAGRVAARCRHFRSCGGCSLQHGSDGFVEGWKADVVLRALRAQGIGPDVTSGTGRPLKVHTSPGQSRRRATLAGRRTKSGAMVGFHGRSSGTITEIPDCRLLAPGIMDLLELLRGITALGASRSTEIGLGVTLTETGPELVVTGAKPADPALLAGLMRLAGERLARISWNGEPLALARMPQVRLGRALVPMPPGAFLQATTEGESALVAAVRAIIGDARRVVDLFAGMGTFALPIAETAAVHAVEGSADLMRALDAGWRGTPGLCGVTTEARDLFRRPLEPDELARFDAAVIDPPRAGAEAQVRALAASKVRRIAMVSCNPVTFARDAALLTAAGYRMDRPEVVDQFRWSPHVELVAGFVRG